MPKKIRGFHKPFFALGAAFAAAAAPPRFGGRPRPRFCSPFFSAAAGFSALAFGAGFSTFSAFFGDFGAGFSTAGASSFGSFACETQND